METIDSLGLPEALLDAFLAECLPDGGIDPRRSRRQVAGRGAAVGALAERAMPTAKHLRTRLPYARLEDHGVEWVHRATSTDPLVNVAMLWLFVVLGVLDARELEEAG
jgi:hypothetical protein